MSGGVEPAYGAPSTGRPHVIQEIMAWVVPLVLGAFAVYVAWISPTGGRGAAAAAQGFSGILTGVKGFLAVLGVVLILLAGAVLMRRQKVTNPRDFFGGLALVGVALVALWASRDLPGMHGFAFGPGTAPRLFAGLLAVLSLIVAAIGYFTEGPAIERFHLRGPALITIALLIFASSIRSLGLVIASFITIVVAASATHEVRWVETLIWAVVLTIFCSLLFPYGLNLPFQLWPRF